MVALVTGGKVVTKERTVRSCSSNAWVGGGCWTHLPTQCQMSLNQVAYRLHSVQRQEERVRV